MTEYMVFMFVPQAQDILEQKCRKYPTSKIGVERDPPSGEGGLKGVTDTRLKVFSV